MFTIDILVFFCKVVNFEVGVLLNQQQQRLICTSNMATSFETSSFTSPIRDGFLQKPPVPGVCDLHLTGVKQGWISNKAGIRGFLFTTLDPTLQVDAREKNKPSSFPLRFPTGISMRSLKLVNHRVSLHHQLGKGRVNLTGIRVRASKAAKLHTDELVEFEKK
jgi:hypothetical protein